MFRSFRRSPVSGAPMGVVAYRPELKLSYTCTIDPCLYFLYLFRIDAERSTSRFRCVSPRPPTSSVVWRRHCYDGVGLRAPSPPPSPLTPLSSRLSQPLLSELPSCTALRLQPAACAPRKTAMTPHWRPSSGQRPVYVPTSMLSGSSPPTSLSC